MKNSTPSWDVAFEARCQAHLAAVVTGRGRDRVRAWQELLLAVAPHVERWARQSRLLRTLRLASEDDVRAVLVRFVERLQHGDYANLRAFLEGRREALRDEAKAAGEDETVASFCDLAAAADEGANEGDDQIRTPLRAWLKGLADFAARDHATARVGRSDRAATPGDTGPRSKRAPNTDAKQMSEGDEPPVAPGMTDWLTLKRIAGEIVAYAQVHLTSQQQTALRMRLDDHSYGEIAQALALPRPQVELLVRAAKERLRLQFREQRGRFGLADEGDEPPQPR